MATGRTAKGNITAAARKAHGATKASPLKTGSFPVIDTKSGEAALKLRGKAPSKKAVIDKVAAYANKTHNKTLQGKVKNARKAK